MTNSTRITLGATVTHRQTDATGRVIQIGKGWVRVKRWIYDGSDGKVAQFETWDQRDAK